MPLSLIVLLFYDQRVPQVSAFINYPLVCIEVSPHPLFRPKSASLKFTRGSWGRLNACIFTYPHPHTRKYISFTLNFKFLSSRIPWTRVCRLHQSDECRYGVDCTHCWCFFAMAFQRGHRPAGNNVHLCRDFLVHIGFPLQNKEEDALLLEPNASRYKL